MSNSKKISELVTAQDINDNDFFPIVQNGITKKNSYNKIKKVKVSQTEPTTGEEVWIKTSSQLLDVSQGFQNAYINSGGGVVSATNNALFDFIKIKGNTTYTASANIVLQGLNFAFFDEGKHFISRQITNSVRSATKLSPTNAKYARIWINYDDVTDITQEIINSLDIMLNEGEILPYEPYIEKGIYCKNQNGAYESFMNTNTIKTQVDTISNNVTNLTNNLGILSVTSEVVSGGTAWSKTLDNATYLIVIARSNGATTAGLYIANINNTSFLTEINRYYSDGTLQLNGKTLSITPNASTAIVILRIAR